MKNPTRKLAVAAALAGAAAAVSAGGVNAFPSGILHAHTSVAASHKAQYGDSTDRLQTQLRCATTSGGVTYVNGPKVPVGTWSQAYCPPGFYRASENVMLWG